ncbi:MAG TPA: hypothetical protein VGI20_04490 [Rhizomicrobium sp.]|jgi:hypothetical protein
MKTAWLVAGIVILLIGLLWFGQGTGYIHWPASSFMINETKWAWIGLGTGLIGAVLVVYSRRRT